MSIARATASLAVLAAAGCTMYFNGRFGWSLGTDLHDKAGLAVFSVAVDLGKCSLLVIAAHAWSARHRGRAALCCALFAVCLAYSLTAGLGFMATTRDLSHAERQVEIDARVRARTAHERARTALATIDADKMWTTTAACTRTPSKNTRTFCSRRAELVSAETTAAAVLARLPPVDADPQARLMADNLGQPIDRIRLALALLPAVLAELLSSLGFYALRRDPTPNSPGRAQDVLEARGSSEVGPDAKTTPVPRPVASVASPSASPEPSRSQALRSAPTYDIVWPG